MLKRMPTPLASWLALLLATIAAHGQSIAGPLRLSVSCSSVTIAQGLTAQCAAKESFFRGSAQPKDVTESVIWSASSGATISNTPGSKGLLTANSPGPATIAASSGPLRASVTVTITPPALLAIDGSPANANIALNEAQQFSASGHYSNATTGPVSVVWSSSSANVADIDTAGGLATPAGPGTTTITATNAASGIFSTSVLNVELAGNIVRPADGSVAKGQQQQFAATGSFNGGGMADVTNAVIWSAAPVSVATISPAGLASTLSQGPATITATSGNTSGNTTLNVGPAIPVGLEVAPAKVALLAGKTQQFTATAVYTDGSRVEVTASANWSSSDSSIATVDGAGLATAKAIGTASIGAAYNSFTASGQLQVRPEARFVYALNADETISGWTFDEISGRLRHNGYTYLPGVQCSKTIMSDPAGKFLYMANSGSGTISAFAINAAGDLARTPLSPFNAGAGPQSMAIDPAGKFLYVANQASAPGVFSGYLFQTNGDLTPLPQPSSATGNNPAALAAHPSGKFLYSANGGSNNITAYAIAADGDLSALGSPVATGSSPIAMAIDPAGNFLLAANNGGTVRVFKIAGDGALVAAGIAAVGQAPSSIILDPSGTRVYVANSGSNTISGFDLNPVTGALTALPGSPFADSGAPSALLMDPVGLYLFAVNTAATEIGIS